MKTWEITFATNLNNNITMKIIARTYQSACNKIKKMFPSAYNFN